MKATVTPYPVGVVRIWDAARTIFLIGPSLSLCVRTACPKTCRPNGLHEFSVSLFTNLREIGDRCGGWIRNKVEPMPGAG